MNMQHLNDGPCPDCGAKVRHKSQYEQHLNGNWNERIEWDCGRAMHYSPNFLSSSVDRACPRSREKIAEAEKKAALKSRLLRIVKASKVNAETKLELSRRLEDFLS